MRSPYRARRSSGACILIACLALLAACGQMIAGPSPLDPLSLPATEPLSTQPRDLRGVRIGLSMDLGYKPIDPDVLRARVAALLRRSEQQGATMGAALKGRVQKNKKWTKVLITSTSGENNSRQQAKIKRTINKRCTVNYCN